MEEFTGISKRIFVSNIGSIVKFMCIPAILLSVNLQANDFSAPLPPPELGDTLTSYKTQKQQMDEYIEKHNSKEKPVVKITLKNKEYDTNNTNVVRRDINNFSYVYTGRKLVKIGKDGEVIIKIKDSSNYPWPIKSAKLTNNNYEVSMLTEGDGVVIKPRNRIAAGAMANLSIELKDPNRSPLSFTISNSSPKVGEIDVHTVQIAYVSPNNPDQEAKGVTNMKITNKSRNSRREVLDTSTVVESVDNSHNKISEPKEDILEGSNQYFEVKEENYLSREDKDVGIEEKTKENSASKQEQSMFGRTKVYSYDTFVDMSNMVSDVLSEYERNN